MLQDGHKPSLNSFHRRITKKSDFTYCKCKFSFTMLSSLSPWIERIQHKVVCSFHSEAKVVIIMMLLGSKIALREVSKHVTNVHGIDSISLQAQVQMSPSWECSTKHFFPSILQDATGFFSIFPAFSGLVC